MIEFKLDPLTAKMPEDATCQICNQVKFVCCGMEGHFCYCRDCCPHKFQHIKDRSVILPEELEPTLEERVAKLEAFMEDYQLRHQE